MTKIMFIVSHYKNRSGRPMYRWSDEVQKDLKVLVASRCKEQAQNLRALQNLVSEAKFHFGSLRH